MYLQRNPSTSAAVCMISLRGRLERARALMAVTFRVMHGTVHQEMAVI